MVIPSNRIPCCLVMDSSVLLTDEYDMCDFLARQLPASPHVVLIPNDVIEELYGLKNSENATIATQAERLLELFKKGPQRHQRTSEPISASTSGLSLGNRLRGVVLRQMRNEAFYPLVKFARNRDTKIVACAHYFTINPATACGSGAKGAKDSLYADLQEPLDKPTKNRPRVRSSLAESFQTRCFGCSRSFFVTNDVLQRLKASAYDIPTIDAATLKSHFRHLGVYSIPDAGED
nr:unnamed protein product [Leishmania braziliensis]